MYDRRSEIPHKETIIITFNDLGRSLRKVTGTRKIVSNSHDWESPRERTNDKE